MTALNCVSAQILRQFFLSFVAQTSPQRTYEYIFMSMVDWQKEKGTTLKAVITAFQALVPTEWSYANCCTAICFQHYHHPARNCDLSFGNFVLEKPKG